MRMKKMLAALLCLVMVLSTASVAASALTPSGNGIKMRDNWIHNNPDYEFSDAYKTSVWYENFTDLELTKNERNNVLRIAITQLGYHEGDSAKDFDGMNTSGTGNYIEYARLIRSVATNGAYNNDAYAWCAAFVNWCINQAGISHAYGEISCNQWVSWFKGRQLFENSPYHGGDYVPKPADFIFFEWKTPDNPVADHIGLVLYTTDTHVYTIEGNTSSGYVTVKSYPLSDSSIIGYGTPAYNENNEPTIDFSYADGAPAGYYVVYNTATGLLNKPEDGARRLSRIPVGHKVAVAEVVNGYAKTSYNGRVGYVSIADSMVFLDSVDTNEITFDANGGENAPAAQTVIAGELTALPTDVPTLEGDTFLGWSTRPFDPVPVYVADAKITVSGNTTLYAVWEKRSAALAADATANGELVNYTRPSAIVNPYAIPAGGLNVDSLVPTSGTSLSKIDDTTFGKVISIASNDVSDDPYFTLPYAELMQAAELPLANAEDVKYIVLRVKSLSLSHPTFHIFYTCEGNENAHVAAATLADGDDWQYLVFDMSEAEHWRGKIQSLRMDYESAASAAGETLLLSDILLLKSDAELTAVTQDGIYPFPAAQKVTEQETEAVTQSTVETQEDTSSDTADGQTTAESQQQDGADESQNDTAQAESDSDASGCGSVVLTSTLSLTLLGAAYVCTKKNKED